MYLAKHKYRNFKGENVYLIETYQSCSTSLAVGQISI